MDKQSVDLDERLCAVVAAQCANARLRAASRTVSQFYGRFMAESGLRSTQFTLLVACAVAGPAPITVLANALGMDRTTLSRNLDVLLKDGLVRVMAGDDRRRRLVVLSDEGQRRLATALPLWEQAQGALAAALGEVRLNDLLGELSAVMDLVQGL